MKILVTGGCGFIGSSFVNYIYNNHKDFQITVVDKLTYVSDIGAIPFEIPVIIKDIIDLKKSDIEDFDYIVNFAAESHVDNSIENGLPFIQSNVVGTFNLLEIARQIPNLKKFVQISTDEVYGDLDLFNIFESSETDRLNPSSYYSSSKSSADQIVLSATHTYGLPTLITRTCNNFGKYQNEEKFIPKIIKTIKDESVIPLYGNGDAIREWIWVEDNVKMIFKLMISDIGIWNIGSGDRYSNKQILDLIESNCGVNVKYENVTDRLGHDKRYSLNSDKLIYKMGKEKYITKTIKDFLIESF
jgi:dTDP-glucose 4,6-dehydratase